MKKYTNDQRELLGKLNAAYQKGELNETFLTMLDEAQQEVLDK